QPPAGRPLRALAAAARPLGDRQAAAVSRAVLGRHSPEGGLFRRAEDAGVRRPRRRAAGGGLAKRAAENQAAPGDGDGPALPRAGDLSALWVLALGWHPR